MRFISERVLFVDSEVLAGAAKALTLSLRADGLQPGQRVLVSDGQSLQLVARVLKVVLATHPFHAEVVTLRFDTQDPRCSESEPVSFSSAAA